MQIEKHVEFRSRKYALTVFAMRSYLYLPENVDFCNVTPELTSKTRTVGSSVTAKTVFNFGW